MPYDEYARWRNSPDCGHMTGTAGSGPSVCGKPPKFTVDASCPFNVNGRACGTHANSAKRRLYAVAPIIEES
ncbi:hypothetical protein [Dactylosporangium sp. CA-139066]|uniref:hypothetical protein n=1 Tax=Dactylosporangium sp. CA-139066 TaxID=3239930 RepID=UPI003D92AEC6